MSIVTKCPGCRTMYRVTPQELQAQHSMVRCGHCATVFDGFKTLATLPDELPFGAEPQSAASGSIEPAAAEVVTRQQVETLPHRRAGGWAFGILLLLIVLAAQVVYFYYNPDDQAMKIIQMTWDALRSAAE